MNYSLLIMETAGMMKMASGDDFPLRQGAGIGLQMVFLWYRGVRRRRRCSRLISGGFSIYRIFQRWNHEKRSYEGPTRQQHTAPPGRAVMPCEQLVRLLVLPRSFGGLFWSQKNFKKFRPIPRTFISAQKTTLR